MTFYENFPKTRRAEPVINICQHCETQYQVGVNGTVLGCDDCTNTARNPIDGTIIEASGFFLDDDTLQSQ
jgi:protein-arginine kinase activator protein McsA